MVESRPNFQTWGQEKAEHFERYAERHLPQPGSGPNELIDAMRYAVLGGGKRIRSLLAYAAGEVSRAEAGVLDSVALSLECIHGYSLVHDDMPAMDNDTLRRGKPTVHVKFGEATALLAGDALQCQAFEALSQMTAEPAMVLRLVKTLSHASGVRGMCGGQAFDLAMVGEKPGIEELSQMQALKTGALIEAAVLMGAQVGQWDRLAEFTKDALLEYADHLGVAFQVVDDILDCTADSQTLGKTAGKDEKDDKPTWVSLLGLEGARARAESLHQAALAALDRIKQDRFVAPDATVRLKEIADYVVLRKF